MPKHPALTPIADDPQADALRTLDNLIGIIGNQRLVHMAYVTDVRDPDRDVRDPDREMQLCRGYHACLIGSLWLAHGVDPVPFGGDWQDMVMPGLTGPTASGVIYDRDAFMDQYAPGPGLRVAYDALNRAAVEFMHETGQDPDQLTVNLENAYGLEGPAECLYESGDVDDQMLAVVERARELVAEGVTA